MFFQGQEQGTVYDRLFSSWSKLTLMSIRDNSAINTNEEVVNLITDRPLK